MKINTHAALLLSSLVLVSCEHYDRIDGHARVSRLHRPSAAAASPAPSPEPAPKPVVKKPEAGPVVAQNQSVSSTPIPEKPAPIAKPLPEPPKPKVNKVEPEVKPALSKPDTGIKAPEAKPATAMPRQKWSWRNLFSRKQPAATTVTPLPESTNADGPIPTELLVTPPAPAKENKKPVPPSKPEVKQEETRPVVSQQQPELKPVPRNASRLPIAPPRASSQTQQQKPSYPVMPGQNRGLKARPL